jgi:type I restriction enzyme M protein
MSNSVEPGPVQVSTIPPTMLQEVDQFFLRIFERVYRVGGTRANHAAALFLLLRKEGSLETFMKEGRRAAHVHQLAQHYHETERTDMAGDVVYALARTLEVLGAGELDALITEFKDVPEAFLGEHYPAVVDRLLYLLARTELSDPYPAALTELALKLADVPSGGSVYHPFAGSASVGALLAKDVHYYGQELYEVAWALGMYRLYTNHAGENRTFHQENSLTEWNVRGARFDLVVMKPPFNTMVDDVQHEFGGGTLSAESLTLRRAMRDTKDTGKVICILPLRFLTSGRKDQATARQEMVDAGLIDSVIEFPGPVLAATRNRFALLVLDKARDRSAPVRMMDASRYVLAVTPRSVTHVQVDALLNALYGKPEEGVLELVQPETIRESGYNLLPLKHIFRADRLVPGGVRLGDQAVPMMLERFESGTKTPYISAQQLLDSPMDLALQVDKLELCEPPHHAKRLDRSALLLAAASWSDLKPTWFEYSGTPIAVAGDILALDVAQERVDIAYLRHELTTEKVQAQVDLLNKGYSPDAPRSRYILDILIELPSLLEQRARIKGVRDAFVKAKVDEARRAAMAHGVRIANFANAASLEHRLGRPLLNLGSGVSLLSRALGDLYPGWSDAVIGGTERGITLGEIMQGMMFELQRISDLLEADSADIDPQKYALAPLDLADYAQRTARRMEVHLNKGHKVVFGVDPALEEHLEGKPYIMGNADLLDIAVDAIVDNAVRHAFPGEEPPHRLDFWVGFKFKDDRPWMVLSIGNSGNPFPAGFELARYVTKHHYAGVTGHTGIGGYHVSRVAEIQGGSVDIDAEPLLNRGRSSAAITLSFPAHIEEA